MVLSFVGIDMVHHPGNIFLCQVIESCPFGKHSSDQTVIVGDQLGLHLNGLSQNRKRIRFWDRPYSVYETSCNTRLIFRAGRTKQKNLVINSFSEGVNAVL